MIKFLKLFFIISICFTFMNCESDPIEMDEFEVQNDNVEQRRIPKQDLDFPCIPLREGKWRVLGSQFYIQYIFAPGGTYIKKINTVTIEQGTWTQTVQNFVDNNTGEALQNCSINLTVDGIFRWHRLDFNAIGVEMQVEPFTSAGGEFITLVFEG